MKNLERLAQVLRDAGKSGGITYDTGVTLGAPVSGWVDVTVTGKGESRAKVPTSFRKALFEAGQEVRLARDGDQLTVDSVTSALPTPSLDETGDEADTWDTTPVGPLGFTAAGFSSSGFTSQDFQCALYAEYVAGFGRGAATDTKNLRDAVNALVEQRNTDRALLDQIRALLIDQGLGKGL